METGFLGASFGVLAPQSQGAGTVGESEREKGKATSATDAAR